MLKRVNKIIVLLLSLPFLFSCTNNANDTTGTKMAQVVGLETSLYLDNNGNYNQSSPLPCDAANVYDIDKANSYYFIINIKIDGGSIPPKIPSSSYSIIYDEQEIKLVGDYSQEYLPLLISYQLSLNKEFNLSPIVIKLGDFNKTIVLRNK